MRIWMGVVLLAACSSSSGGKTTYTHSSPNFTATVPGGLKAGQDQFENGGNASVDLHDESFKKDILFSWNNLTPGPDGMAQFDGKWLTGGAVVSVQGKTLDGKGKYVVMERHGTRAAHSVTLVGKIAVECMASNPPPGAEAELFGACESLAAAP
jgi:hypothetical protein